MQGFYCLIQYCPDFGRAEAANVGLMIFQTDPPVVAVRVVDDARPAVKRLGRRDDAATVLECVQSMKYRIEHEGFRDLEALEKFVRTRGNRIQLTMPRSMRIEALAHDLDRMFAELVDIPRARRVRHRVRR